ncbi:MAG: hypothetical protein ACXW1Z_24785 [Methylobacter sp.]
MSKRDIVIPVVPYLALGEKQADSQTFQVFTGAAPGGSSTSVIHGSRSHRFPTDCDTSAIHGSRKTWKV